MDDGRTSRIGVTKSLLKKENKTNGTRLTSAIQFNSFRVVYIPVKNAIAAIIPRNNRIIPMATNVSCSSTELIFFITYHFKN